MAGAMRRSPPLPLSSARLRVLVVDDEPHIARSMQRVLRDIDVELAETGRDAIARALAEPFDVIFCDLMMPEVSGIDVYEALRQRAPGLETRLVFMTGGAFTARARAFLARVPNPQLEKPFDIQSVKDLVDEVATRHGLARTSLSTT